MIQVAVLTLRALGIPLINLLLISHELGIFLEFGFDLLLRGVALLANGAGWNRRCHLQKIHVKRRFERGFCLRESCIP
jgi:hypothetical protein